MDYNACTKGSTVFRAFEKRKTDWNSVSRFPIIILHPEFFYPQLIIHMNKKKEALVSLLYMAKT